LAAVAVQQTLAITLLEARAVAELVKELLVEQELLTQAAVVAVQISSQITLPMQVVLVVLATQELLTGHKENSYGTTLRISEK
jgi:hypothetical protein